MNVVIDGIIYKMQAWGGIARIFNEILPRICNIDRSLHITLLSYKSNCQTLPAHDNIHDLSLPQAQRFLRPGFLWRPFVPKIQQQIYNLFLKELQKQIWHSSYYTLPDLWKGPLVITVPDMAHERYPEFFGKEIKEFRKLKQRCILNADAIIAISQTTKNDLISFYAINADKIWVVPPACSDVFREKGADEHWAAIIPGKPYLLYVGIRSHYKNVDRLIEAYRQWRGHEEVDLVVVGRPWTLNQIDELKRLGLDRYVHLLGHIDDRTLAKLYRRAVALVYPSLYEGFGIPLLEAMACGCPIVASKIPSTIEVAGKCPVYFDPQDSDSMVNAFEIALTEGRNSARVEKGFEKIKHYSWDKTAQQTLEVYRGL
ncbi:MAG: glycosyltransferase family 1 protein [Thermodesulfobacteriota bacterium]